MTPREQVQHQIDLIVQLCDQMAHANTWIQHPRLTVIRDELIAATDHLYNARRHLDRLAANEGD